MTASLPAHTPRLRTAITALVAMSVGSAALAVMPHAAAAPAPAPADPTPIVLPYSENALRVADIGFADWTRNGSERTLRNDLNGSLSGQVDFAQETTTAPTGNAASERPDLVAERAALLLVRPTSAAQVTGLRAQVRVSGAVVGTLPLAPPQQLPATDQNFGERGSVAWSLRAWSVKLPWQWVRPGLSIVLTADSTSGERTGTLARVDLAPPHELVVNNIQLGMLTSAPDRNDQRFLKDPAGGASDYFGTVPVARLTMAAYEKVELDRVIVASGAVLTGTSQYEGADTYSGDLRENVGKAQVSTGINLATWGITSAPMNQSQPQVTNQRVIHHSAGSYLGTRVEHGLSGGNGMATLHASVGNELSHELGHSYGLPHYPGSDDSAAGDLKVRNASHHMDSGWGWIDHRSRMRSNLRTGPYRDSVQVGDHSFTESLLGTYNFNTDAMSGGFDDSPLSDYTLHTGYSLKRIQSSLKPVVADTTFPSGYRTWRPTGWVDAAVADPGFSRPRPRQVGVEVFTLLGGYNPADPAQSLLYPAFRSNYGTVFDLPQAAPAATGPQRQCWIRVAFDGRPTQRIALDAADGVKQLNVNLATADRPTGAQVQCRADGVTVDLAEPITIATDLPSMPAPVVVGQEQGYEALRRQELSGLEARLLAQAGDAAPVLSAADGLILRGWSDDLSHLSSAARAVAQRLLAIQADAEVLTAHLDQYEDALANDDAALDRLAGWLAQQGHTETPDRVLPERSEAVTVDGGKCLTLDTTRFGSVSAPAVRATETAALCTGNGTERWWVDLAGRIHPTTRPDLCMRAATPVQLVSCSTSDAQQRWVVQPDGHVVRAGDLNSAMDLYRSNHRPGLYGRSSGSNQIWRGLVTSPNPVLAVLEGDALRRLFVAPRVTVRVRTSVAAAASGWFTSRPAVDAAAGVALTGRSLVAEVSVDGAAWQASGVPVPLGEGVHTVRARVLDPDSGLPRSAGGTISVDTVAPSLTVSAPAGTTVGSALMPLAQDATSGVDRIEYRVGQHAWQVWTAAVGWPRSAGALQVRAVDRAGNVSAVRTVSRPEAAAAAPKLKLAVARRARVGVRVKVGIKAGSSAVSSAGSSAGVEGQGAPVPWSGTVRVTVKRGGTVLKVKRVSVRAGIGRYTLPRKATMRPGRVKIKVSAPATSTQRPTSTRATVLVRVRSR